MDHDLMTPCTLGFIAHDDLIALNGARPNLAEAIWRETLIDASIFREWIVNVGRRSATARLAHLLVELHRRLEAIGHTKDGEFDLPVTQADLADCLGLSTVHINRVLQFLRKEGFLTADRSDFRLVEPKKMEDLAGFDATYLHRQPNA
jgi:CRP-like cAMP-binding protein